LSGPDAISASALSKQVDVSQSTLSKWLRMAGDGPSYGFSNNAHEYTKMAKIKNPKRPNDWSAKDKLKVVVEAASLDDEQLGAFLRKKGLHQAHLDQWRSQMLDVSNSAPFLDFSPKQIVPKLADQVTTLLTPAGRQNSIEVK